MEQQAARETMREHAPRVRALVERSSVRHAPTFEGVRVTAVIPTKNEERNLPYVLPALPPCVDEVVIVDAGSTDRTREVALELRPDAVVVVESAPGKGRALWTGFEAATGDVIVCLDADGSTDPSEIPAFVAALIAGADYAKGSRFLHGAASHDLTFTRRLGNLGLLAAVRATFGGRYTDLCYGYFAFWRDCLPALRGRADGFEIETLLNIRALVSRLAVVEVASVETDRVHGASNLRATRDGLRVLRTILREWRAVRANHHGPPANRDVLVDLTTDPASVTVGASTLTTALDVASG